MGRLLARIIKVAVSMVILGALGFCLFVNLVNAPHKGETDAANRASAQQIVAALAAHRADTGAYPNGLQALVPKYVATLPTVQPTGAEFRYELIESGTDYALAYPEAPIGALPSDAEYEHRASTEAWELKLY